MSRVSRYFFDPMIDRDGSLLPFSRADVVASIVVALSFMFSFAFSLGGFERIALFKCLGAAAIGLVTLLWTTRRRLVLGAALSIVSLRLVFGLIFIVHTVPMLIATLVCCGITMALLKEGSPQKTDHIVR